MIGEVYKEMVKILNELGHIEKPTTYTEGYMDCIRYFMDLIETEELYVREGDL